MSTIYSRSSTAAEKNRIRCKCRYGGRMGWGRMGVWHMGNNGVGERKSTSENECRCEIWGSMGSVRDGRWGWSSEREQDTPAKTVHPRPKQTRSIAIEPSTDFLPSRPNLSETVGRGRGG